MQKAICLIPAKGFSTRLIRKNLLPINGTPMVVLAIEKALEATIFDTVCVSTEDEEIASLAIKNDADVPFMRPIKLSKDPATIVDVMRHALEYYKTQGMEFGKICVLLPTAPFVTVDDIVTANRLFDSYSKNALLSVCPTEYPPFNAWLINETEENRVLDPCFPDSAYKYTKSTECPRTYRSNGAILIVRTDQLLNEGTYRNKPIQPYIMPVERSVDIDTQFDYEFSKFLASAGEFKN
jgi:CMP-N-acetylneuraminic acid synthetase